MPTSYHIDGDHRLVYSRGWGVVNSAELVAHAQTLRVDPRFDPSFRQILDFTHSVRLSFSYKTMRGLARLAPFAKTARRIAVVRSELVYGLFRMYESLLGASLGRLTAVRTLTAAFDALDIPVSDRDAVTSTADRTFDGATPD